jgi:hypothetical protein
MPDAGANFGRFGRTARSAAEAGDNGARRIARPATMMHIKGPDDFTLHSSACCDWLAPSPSSRPRFANKQFPPREKNVIGL